MLPAIDLPITSALGPLADAVRTDGAAVLVAPPGSGKTTLAPLALAEAVRGRVIVAEPRRVATRAAARRMAAVTGTEPGDLVGYSVRGDRSVSVRTRVEVVTTGLLVRRLLADPELPGVGAVIVDECHERHIDTDLALAFLSDVRENLRDDLVVVAASATADVDRMSEILGGAPVVSADASPFDVDVVWSPPSRPTAPALGPRVDPALLRHVAGVVRTALADREGDVLVFLPGVGEIERVARLLSGLDVDVLRLHGGLSAADQDRTLSRSARRRVVLSTSIAESSLTVPGVRVVVDAGLTRQPWMDHARGMGSLRTVPVSRAAAAQRAGRAAREAPGSVYRCWSAADHDRRPAQPSPEIALTDLADAVLSLARWGSMDGSGLRLPDAPPTAAVESARRTLTALGAIDAEGAVTARGRRIADVGVHPRLAAALLDGVDLVGDVARDVVAALAVDARPRRDDVDAWLVDLRADRDPASRPWRDERRRLGRSVGGRRPSATGASTGVVVALAYPERIARVREGDPHVYLTAGGTAVRLGDRSPLVGQPWIAVAEVDRREGAVEGRVRLAAPIDRDDAERVGAPMLGDEREAGWIDGDLAVVVRRRLGAIVLSRRSDGRPTGEERAAAVRDGLNRVGLGLLRWTDGAIALRRRLAFCRHALGDEWPDVSDAALTAGVDAWLGPDLGDVARRSDLQRVDVAGALRRLLTWRQAASLDDLAPERLAVPSGSRLRVDYRDPGVPVLAGKLQEFFGMTATPRIAGGRVPVTVHLLSPAGRPAAITADLASFWGEGYRMVRADLRGRYPRHPWPEDPTTAIATRRANRRG